MLRGQRGCGTGPGGAATSPGWSPGPQLGLPPQKFPFQRFSGGVLPQIWSEQGLRPLMNPSSAAAAPGVSLMEFGCVLQDFGKRGEPQEGGETENGAEKGTEPRDTWEGETGKGVKGRMGFLGVGNAAFGIQGLT